MLSMLVAQESVFGNHMSIEITHGELIYQASYGSYHGIQDGPQGMQKYQYKRRLYWYMAMNKTTLAGWGMCALPGRQELSFGQSNDLPLWVQ